jgi:hypothetical protein
MVALQITLCFLCFLSLGPAISLSQLAQRKRVSATAGVTVAIAFAVSIAVANTDNRSAPVGRRHAVSRSAFRSRARDRANARRSDVVWH